MNIIEGPLYILDGTLFTLNKIFSWIRKDNCILFNDMSIFLVRHYFKRRKSRDHENSFRDFSKKSQKQYNCREKRNINYIIRYCEKHSYCSEEIKCRKLKMLWKSREFVCEILCSQLFLLATFSLPKVDRAIFSVE